MIVQKNILPHFNNKLEEQIIKLFHHSNLPQHFNKTGNKEFTNYQRIAIIILYRRSRKSLRDFVEEIRETKWPSWLGLKKSLKRSTLHDWLKKFSLKMIRDFCKTLVPEDVELTSIDSTGIDAWQRSRHYEKRCNEIEDLTPMNYAKTSIFVDVKSKIIIDWDLVMSREHDVKIAERIFKRNTIKGIRGLGDKGYDSEHLHEIARENGIEFFAPVRKMDKRGFKDQRPGGFYRRQCKYNPPKDRGMRSIVENVNSVLKGKQIFSLRSKKHFMRERELGWHIVLYDLNRVIKMNSSGEVQTFLFLKFIIYVFPDNAKYWKNLKITYKKSEDNKIKYSSI